MKKNYFQPKTRMVNAHLNILMGQSKLDPTKGDQNVMPTDDTYEGLFGAKGIRYWEL